MTTLKFHGLVTIGDGWRVSDDDVRGYIHIGGCDIVAEIGDARFTSPVTFAMADGRFTGDLDIDCGWGYSEYTPVDFDRLLVGDTRILDILEAHVGEEITVWFSDEPVNVLEGLIARGV